MQVNIDMSAACGLPALWSAEEPNLYIVVLSLVTQHGELLDNESTQVLLSPSLSPLKPDRCLSQHRVCEAYTDASARFYMIAMCIMRQVGFREVIIEGRQLLVNRRPIMVKGVNRHEHDERRGKSVTEEGMLADIYLLKQLNFNAVRCSHYPNAPRW